MEKKDQAVPADAADPAHAPAASVRRPSIKVKTREQRQRRAPTSFSPSAATPLRKSRKPETSSPVAIGTSLPVAATPPRPEHKRLENRVKSQAHRLRYPLAFIEAYEADGWRKSSRDKLRPNKELEVEHRKIVKGKRALIDGLRELKALNAHDPVVPPQAVFEDVHCSRCGSTDIEPDNDILLCDSPGCHRAYHQKCQTPIVLTAKIPAGAELWFCEVCLAIFECLKSINSVFGTTYESTQDLFPELAQSEQQVAMDESSTAQSSEKSVSARADEDEDEEDDEDFVCDEGEADEDEDDEDSDEKASGDVADEGEEEISEEVPEGVQDLLFLNKDDVIDLNHRSMRSKSASRLPKPAHKKRSLLGELAAKIDRKTGGLILGVVAELEPPSKGKYSRWRIDYRDGSSELLTRIKTQAAINRAAVEDHDDGQHGDGSEGDSALIVRGKRKRNDVDYRELNSLMFAGKDEDSEDDENFEVKEGSDGESDDDEEDNNDEEKSYNEGEGEQKCVEGVPDQKLTTAVTAPHDKVSEASVVKRSHRKREFVDYHSMHEGLYS